jgi:hypothetical protein
MIYNSQIADTCEVSCHPSHDLIVFDEGLLLRPFENGDDTESCSSRPQKKATFARIHLVIFGSKFFPGNWAGKNLHGMNSQLKALSCGNTGLCFEIYSSPCA